MNLGPYYIDLNTCLGEDFSEYEFSQQGIPMTRFHRKPDWQHNPITVCQYGLHHFNNYLRNKQEQSRQIFLAQANWLLENAETGSNDAAVWRYRVEIPFYNISAPWISGMAQGQAVSVLLRAHQLTDEVKYRETGRRAWRIFQVPVDEGGVVSFFPDSRPIVEEYPAPHFMTGVLNGFIFAIFGVYDFAQYLNDEEANQFFHESIESLKNNLHRYDSGYWSYYDLKSPQRLASKPYHRLHIEQLKVLFDIAGEELFRTFEARWRGYLFSTKSNMRWLVRKAFQKLIPRINSN